MSVLNIIGRVKRRFDIGRELLSFFAANQHWWLLPMLMTLLLFGTLIVLAQNPVIGPFIYSLF